MCDHVFFGATSCRVSLEISSCMFETLNHSYTPHLWLASSQECLVISMNKVFLQAKNSVWSEISIGNSNETFSSSDGHIHWYSGSSDFLIFC